MRVAKIKAYFEKLGYATSFKPNDYILLPNILDDIYRGTIGEAVGRAIFESEFNIELEEITDLDKFEKFDYCLKANKNVYIDFKHWSHSAKHDVEEFAKISNKKNKIGAKAVFVINVMSEESGYKIYRDPNDKDIIVVPWLVVNKLIGGPQFDAKRTAMVKSYVGNCEI